MPENETPKCFTNWEAFSEARLVLKSIKCQDYGPVHRIDTSCHTTFPPELASLLRHLEHSPNGGFEVELRQTDGKGDKIWKELKDAGVEIHDFRCDVCNTELPLVPRRILKHLQPHAGRTHNTVPGGKFLVTLKLTPPEEGDGDEF